MGPKSLGQFHSAVNITLLRNMTLDESLTIKLTDQSLFLFAAEREER
jgi:hypothetical protein